MGRNQGSLAKACNIRLLRFKKTMAQRLHYLLVERKEQGGTHMNKLFLILIGSILVAGMAHAMETTKFELGTFTTPIESRNPKTGEITYHNNIETRPVMTEQTKTGLVDEVTHFGAEGNDCRFGFKGMRNGEIAETFYALNGNSNAERSSTSSSGINQGVFGKLGTRGSGE